MGAAAMDTPAGPPCSRGCVVCSRSDILQHVATVAAQLSAWDQALPARSQVLDLLQVL